MPEPRDADTFTQLQIRDTSTDLINPTYDYMTGNELRWCVGNDDRTPVRCGDNSVRSFQYDHRVTLRGRTSRGMKFVTLDVEKALKFASMGRENTGAFDGCK